MTPEHVDQRRAAVRRALSFALITALCFAALTAIAAILEGDFDDTDARVIGTSIGFAVFSAAAASGASLRFRPSETLRSLGLVTMAVSGVAFALLCVALWSDGADELWQWFGCAAVTALACSHASLVSSGLRATDTSVIRGLVTASLALVSVDGVLGILAISEAVDEVDDAFAQLMAVLVILLLLTTVLPPILRRVQRAAAAPVARPSAAAPAPPELAAEVLAAIGSIEALNADPGNRAPEIRRECERLRELIRSYSG